MNLTGEFKLFGNKITHWLGKVLTVILPVFTENPYCLFPYLQNPCQYHFCRNFVFEPLLLEAVLKLSDQSCAQDKMGSCGNSGLCSLVKNDLCSNTWVFSSLQKLYWNFLTYGSKLIACRGKKGDWNVSCPWSGHSPPAPALLLNLPWIHPQLWSLLARHKSWRKVPGRGGLPKLLWLKLLSNICWFSCDCANSMGRGVSETVVASGGELYVCLENLHLCRVLGAFLFTFIVE